MCDFFLQEVSRAFSFLEVAGFAMEEVNDCKAACEMVYSRDYLEICVGYQEYLEPWIHVQYRRILVGEKQWNKRIDSISLDNIVLTKVTVSPFSLRANETLLQQYKKELVEWVQEAKGIVQGRLEDYLLSGRICNERFYREKGRRIPNKAYLELSISLIHNLANHYRTLSFRL